MRSLIIGLGVQGRKRAAIAGTELAGTVDPVAADARYRQLDDVPPESFDAALVCTPDGAKLELLRRLLSLGKHVLVEKPLLTSGPAPLRELAELARAGGACCYTAYNHRFEPHLVRLAELIASGTLGKIHLLRFFYGNGTARDVQNSPWRDRGLGVLADLGSHLFDLVLFLLGPSGSGRHYRSWACHRLENRAYDHCAFGSAPTPGAPAVHCEVSLVSWKNTFAADVDGLCKWGPSRLTIRRRVLPSGRPSEDVHIIEQPDPTWALEYAHFKKLCEAGGTNLHNDEWIAAALDEVAASAEQSHSPGQGSRAA